MRGLARKTVAVLLWNHVLWFTWCSLLLERWTAWLIPEKYRHYGDYSSRIGRFFWRMMFNTHAFWRVRIEGQAPQQQDRPFIYVMNHQSLLDVPVTMYAGLDVRYVSDFRFLQFPLFGPYLRRMRTVPCDLRNPFAAEGTLHECRSLLRAGRSIFVFPEGTRTRTGKVGHFHMGPFRLAAELGVPVVPMIIDGTREVLAAGQWAPPLSKLLQGHFTLRILEPIEPPGPHRESAMMLRDQVHAVIESEVQAMNRGESIATPIQVPVFAPTAIDNEK